MHRKHDKVTLAVLLFLPVLFLFGVYWYGLKNWFEQDDFAWLGLHRQVTDLPSFLDAMFAPMAQGTIRPWSERGFFLLFFELFQANALPYHIAVFVTQTANLILLSFILLKLTGSRIAAVAAPVFWTANSALLTPLCWVSDYNQVQCAFFLLLAFLLYLHGRYWLQFLVFLLGFGSLELNIVYPAVVLGFVLACRPSRKNVLATIPLFVVSAVYYAWHFSVAPRQTTGIYVLYLDDHLVQTFWTYWHWVFAPPNSHRPLSVVLLFTAAIIGFVSAEIKQGRRLPLFFLFWFLLTLAPTLPLRDHISDYYLAIPVLGIGVLFALALSHGATAVRIAALALACFYLVIHVPLARFGARWYFGHTRAVRNLVWGVQQARQIHPGKTILLTGLSNDLYLDSVAHSVFRSLNIPDVYLAPETLNQVIRLDPDNPDAMGYVLPAGPAVRALQEEKLAVYSAAGERLRNITSIYERAAGQKFGWSDKTNLPRRLDAAAPLLAYLLGSTWYPPVGTFRWMPKRASFRMGGPLKAGSRFRLNGYCSPEQTRSAPLTLSVSVDGKLLSIAKISKPETSFSRTLLLPDDLIGREEIEVVLEVDRTLQNPAGSPPLGLAFGIFEIR